MIPCWEFSPGWRMIIRHLRDLDITRLRDGYPHQREWWDLSTMDGGLCAEPGMAISYLHHAIKYIQSDQGELYHVLRQPQVVESV